jgi:hypothetical protein
MWRSFELARILKPIHHRHFYFMARHRGNARFYDDWMSRFPDIYGVTRSDVRRPAIEQYGRAAALAGPLLPNLMSHFKWIVFRKAA